MTHFNYCSAFSWNNRRQKPCILSFDFNRLPYSDETCFQCCFSNKLYGLTFPFQIVSPSPMTWCISKHEWAFIHHNIFLSWARGPGFLRGDQSQFSMVKTWQVCKAGFSRQVRTSSPEGGWWSRSVRPKSHGKTAVTLDRVWKCDIWVCISWWDSKPVLASLGVNSSPRHPAAEGLIWLPPFPFSDSCTKLCVSLALSSGPLRAGSSQLEAQGETIIELN